MSSLYGASGAKVRGGIISGPNLCETCRNCQVIQGRATTKRYQFCSATYHQQQINFDVVECSFYENKALVDLFELKRVAWYYVVIDHDGNRSFVPMDVFRKMNQARQPESAQGGIGGNVPTLCEEEMP